MTKFVNHYEIAYEIARNAVDRLRDTGALAIAEITDPLPLEDDDFEQVGIHINDLADRLDAVLDEEEGG